MTPSSSVYILVINWNGREHLEACFKSLVNQTYSRARFLLLDNGSTDGSQQFVRDRFGHDERVEVLDWGANLGWSGGNNRGIEAALREGADYVFLLNNDTAVAEDAVERLVATAEAQPDAGAFAPKMVLFNDPGVLNSVGLACSVIGSCWDIGLGRIDGEQWNRTGEIIGVCGGAMFLRREALERAGLLPEDYGIYLDDLELCLRIWNAGYSIHACPEAVVRHKFSATMGEGAKARWKYYLNTRNRWRLILRNFPAAQLPRVLLLAALGEARACGRAALEREWWRAAAHARAWGAALAYLPAALAERRGRRKRGLSTCRFWRLIRRRPLFFPGTVLPEGGWYPIEPVDDEAVHPMARRASWRFEAGTHHIRHMHPSPRLGAPDITVWRGSERAGRIYTADGGITVALERPDTLAFEAERIFTAEETGLPHDCGGWLAWESEPPIHEPPPDSA